MYDITIIGAGVSGIFLAYTLLQTEIKLKILMIEKGRKFIERICPIESGLSKKCINCKICNKVQGFGGMGRCEGKFNYTNDFGGHLGEKIGNEKAIELMEYVDKTLCLFGADKVKLYSTENEKLSRRAKENNCSILTTKEQLVKNSIEPTLEGDGGNLCNEIPEIYINAVLRIFESIEKLIGEEIHKDTLLYGVDVKFYEPEISTNEYFETNEQGLYVIGDCSGITYSLSQAAASAVYLGRYLLNKNN